MSSEENNDRCVCCKECCVETEGKAPGRYNKQDHDWHIRKIIGPLRNPNEAFVLRCDQQLLFPISSRDIANCANLVNEYPICTLTTFDLILIRLISTTCCSAINHYGISVRFARTHTRTLYGFSPLM